MPNYNNNFGYGNGYPYGMPYQPYNYQYNNPFPSNNNGQNYQQNNQQVGSQQPQMNQYAFVNGIEGAKSFQLAPNQTILLMDSDSPLCYMKSSNGVGQSTLRYFKLTEVSENDLKSSTQQPQVNTNDYVLKADFEALSQKVNTLLGKVEKTNRNENLKGNKENKNE